MGPRTKYHTNCGIEDKRVGAILRPNCKEVIQRARRKHYRIRGSWGKAVAHEDKKKRRDDGERQYRGKAERHRSMKGAHTGTTHSHLQHRRCSYSHEYTQGGRKAKDRKTHRESKTKQKSSTNKVDEKRCVRKYAV